MTDTAPTHKQGAAWWSATLLICLLGGVPAVFGMTPGTPGDDHTLDLGIPSGAFGATLLAECLRRDRTLQADLANTGMRLVAHTLPTDHEIAPRIDGTRLEAGFLGDMAAISAAATGDILIVALVQQGFSSLITRAPLRLGELRGRRIGHPHDLSAHFTLLQALRSAGIGIDEVALVPMEARALPHALPEGRIDLLAAGEPAATVALTGLPGGMVVYRRLSTSFFVLSRNFAATRPEAAQALGAALLRAIHWLKRGTRHQERAAGWALAAGGLGDLSIWQATGLLRREIIDLAGAPLIPYRYQERGGLLGEGLHLLQTAGALPETLDWGRISASLDTESLRTLLRLAPHAKLRVYDYAAEPLSP